MIFPC